MRVVETGCQASNKRRVQPRMAQHETASRALQRNAAYAQAIMCAVLLFGGLGVVWTVTFPPAWSLVHGDSWAVDLWSLSGMAAIVAAALASAFVRSTACLLAVLAGTGVALFAALAADPNAQGPGFNVLAMLCDLCLIGCAIAVLGRVDVSARA
jgi:hypothetical protein